MILVTGGTGFIASHIVARLAARGCRVVAMDLRAPDPAVQAFWEPYREQIQFVPGDIRDGDAIANLLATYQIDRVVHAATLSPNAAKELAAPETVLNIGIMGTAAVLTAAAKHGVKRLVYLSSASIYEPIPSPEAVLDEGAALRTQGLYPLTKVAGEWFTRHVDTTSSTEAVSLRIAACYGPMERDTGARTTMSAIWQMAHLALHGETIRVGTPDYVLDFTHVHDIAEGACCLLLAPSLGHNVYNVAGGVGYSLRAVAEEITRLVEGARVEITAPDAEGAIAAQPGSRHGRLSINRIRHELGFEPTYDLRSGLAQYLNWLSRHPF